MNCPTDLIRRSAAGDELEAAELRELAEHTRQCASCRVLIRQETRLTELVRGLMVPPPAGFHAQVMAAVRRSAAVVFADRREWRLAAGVAAAMLVVGAICVLLDQSLVQPASEPLDDWILAGFALIADSLVFGLKTAVAAGQAGLQLLEIAAKFLNSLGRWLVNVHTGWVFVMLSLFALSHGALYWILRQQPNPDAGR